MQLWFTYIPKNKKLPLLENLIYPEKKSKIKFKSWDLKPSAALLQLKREFQLNPIFGTTRPTWTAQIIPKDNKNIKFARSNF